MAGYIEFETDFNVGEMVYYLSSGRVYEAEIFQVHFHGTQRNTGLIDAKVSYDIRYKIRTGDFAGRWSRVDNLSGGCLVKTVEEAVAIFTDQLSKK